jgi:hypothetical protein
LENSFITQLDEAALVEHNPTIRIVRINRPRRSGSRDQIVMGIVHDVAVSMTMAATEGQRGMREDEDEETEVVGRESG